MYADNDISPTYGIIIIFEFVANWCNVRLPSSL